MKLGTKAMLTNFGKSGNDKRYYDQGGRCRSRVSRNPTTDDGVQIDSERQELQRLTECIRELLRLQAANLHDRTIKLWAKIKRLGVQVLPNQPFRQAWKVDAVPSEQATRQLSLAIQEVVGRVACGDRERFIRTTRRKLQERSKKSVSDFVKLSAILNKAL